MIRFRSKTTRSRTRHDRLPSARGAGPVTARAVALGMVLLVMMTASCGSENAPVTAATVTAKQLTFLDEYAVKAEFPEGGAYDKVAGVFYFGSLKDGSVHRLDAETGQDIALFKETELGTWWTLGMDVDLTRNRLWVCAMDDKKPGPRAGFVWVFDMKTGTRIANHALSAAAKDATCTDVAVTKDGVGYVVDREQPNVYRVDFDTGAALFASDPALKGTFAGQNAAVILPDESALLSVVYDPPSLVRVDLSSAAVKKVTITGAFSDDKSLLAGADGMAYSDGAVHVAFSAKVFRLQPASGKWTAATATATDVKEGVTDVIATPGGLYALNGQAVRFALSQTPDPFVLKRLK